MDIKEEFKVRLGDDYPAFEKQVDKIAEEVSPMAPNLDTDTVKTLVFAVIGKFIAENEQ